MTQITTEVRQACVEDAPRMLQLLDQAVRQYVPFGREDLHYLLAQQRVWLADASGYLWGFLCVTPRSPTIADLRALALVNGWRVDTGVETLLTPIVTELREREVETLLCFGAAAWLVPPLQRAEFTLADRIVFFEWSASRVIPKHDRPGNVRPVQRGDLPMLLALDTAAFPELWRFDRGHFMELLVTRSHSVFVEMAGRPVGYAICDVVGDTGFIARLAVHPDAAGQGVGSQLLGDCLEYCRSQGASFVRLNTQESNVASHRLYGRFELQRVGRRVPVLVRDL